MSKRKWKLPAMSLLLFLVLLADGALAGTVFAIARHQSGTFQSSTAQPSTIQASTTWPSTTPLSSVRPSGPRPSIPQASTAQPRQVALTFDDGPHQTCTPALLDGLKKRGVKATFFLMGENIAGKESLVQRMQAEGHLIGNHSYRHIQMTKEGAEQACAEIEQTETLIQDITGRRPEYLRPPYGAWNEQLECRVNLTTVLWNVDSLDWKLQNTEQIVRRVEKDVKNGDIILMHDIFPTSVEAALRIVDDLQKQGYEFVTVEELLVD